MANLERLSLDYCRQFVGAQLGDPGYRASQHLLLSIAEYLKDAARWQYVYQHQLVEHSGTPEEFKQWVDQQIQQQRQMSSSDASTSMEMSSESSAAPAETAERSS